MNVTVNTPMNGSCLSRSRLGGSAGDVNDEERDGREEKKAERCVTRWLSENPILFSFLVSRQRCRMAEDELKATASISSRVAQRKSPGIVCFSALAAVPSATALVSAAGFSRYPARNPAA